jgi:hypothetical protein
MATIFHLYREIASAIKLLLDSVNDVLKNYTSTGRIMEHKRVSCAVRTVHAA